MSYSVVASSGTGGGASSAPSVTLDSSGADRIFLAYGTSGSRGAGSPTISDNKGNTYTQLTRYTGSDPFVQIAYSQDSPTVGAGHTITFTGNQMFFGALAVLAVSGSLNSPFDTGTDNGNGSGSVSSLQLSSSTTPSVNNAILVCAGVQSNLTSPTCDSGFSTAAAIPGVSGASYQLGMFYLIQTTATAEQPTISFGGSNNAAVAIAAFKPSGGGGGKLFTPSNMDGIGSGGPFFSDRLAA